MKKTFTLLAFLTATVLFAQKLPSRFSVETGGGLLGLSLKNGGTPPDRAKGWHVGAFLVYQLKNRHHLRLGLEHSGYLYSYDVGCFDECIYWKDFRFLDLELGHQFYFLQTPDVRISMTNGLFHQLPTNKPGGDSGARGTSYAGGIGAEFQVSKGFALKFGGVYRRAFAKYQMGGFWFTSSGFSPVAYGLEVCVRKNFFR